MTADSPQDHLTPPTISNVESRSTEDRKDQHLEAQAIEHKSGSNEKDSEKLRETAVNTRSGVMYILLSVYPGKRRYVAVAHPKAYMRENWQSNHGYHT